MCIVCTTNEGLYARVSEHKQGHLHYSFITATGEEKSFEASFTDDLASYAAKGEFFAYVAGTVATLLNMYIKDKNLGELKGIRISNYKTTLPLKKGLSSSAAVCTLVAKSFNSFYGKLCVCVCVCVFVLFLKKGGWISGGRKRRTIIRTCIFLTSFKGSI
jgi:galactokinase